MISLKKKSKKEILRSVHNLILVIVGTAILGFGVGVFILPFDLVTGGIPGIAVLLKEALPFEFLTKEDYSTIVSIVLFIMGYFILGKGFALKTLTSTLVYIPVIYLCRLFVTPDVLDGFFYLIDSNYKEVAIVIAAVFGGVFVGAGVAITFMGGGSTGGVDIIALSLCKFFPKIKSSKAIFVIDAALVVLGMFILEDFILTLLGVTSAFVCALVIDYIFVGQSKEFVAYVITDKAEEINVQVRERLDRSTTFLTVVGGYSKEDKTMLMVSFTLRQYNEFNSILSLVDKDAFVTIHRAHEVSGKGFTIEKRK